MEIQEGPENMVCRLALLSKESLKTEWKMEWDGSDRKEQNKLSWAINVVHADEHLVGRLKLDHSGLWNGLVRMSEMATWKRKT